MLFMMVPIPYPSGEGEAVRGVSAPFSGTVLIIFKRAWRTKRFGFRTRALCIVDTAPHM